MKNKKIILAMCLGIFLVMLDTTIMNIALPEIQNGLSTNLSNVSWALNAYTIAFASLTIPFGKLANIYGKRIFYIFALILFGLGSLISGLSMNITSLIVGRIIQSIGAAVIFPLSMDIAINSQTGDFKKKATLFVGITQGSASAFGPVLGGMITQFLSWRWIFLINIPVILISLYLCYISLPKDEYKEKNKIDWIGTVLTISALFSLTLMLIKFRDWGWNLVTLLLLVLFILSSIAFYFYEKQTPFPMIDFDLFKSEHFNLAALGTFLGQFFLVGFMVIMPTFLSNIYNKTAFQAALLVTPATFMIFILSPLAGKIMKKINPKVLLSLGFLIIGLGYSGLAMTSIPLNYAVYIVSSAAVGSGYGLIVGPISVLSTVDFSGSKLTTSQSVIGVLRQLGTVLSVAIFVSFLNANLTQAKIDSKAFSEEKIETLQISKSEKKSIEQSVDKNLNGHTQNKNSINSDSQVDKIVNEEYSSYLKENHLTENQLNKTEQQKIRLKITNNVKEKLTMIDNTLTIIVETIQKNYAEAFTMLYLYSIPVTILISILFRIIPTKKLNIRRE